MNIEELQTFCLSFRGATEDIKWEDNLVFSVAEKIFCLAGLEPPLRVAFKVDEEEFEELTQSEGIIQAPHFARRKWVLVTDEERLSRADWELHIRNSYNLVKSKLPKKKQEELNQIS
jgi:predicted DNA-binding protein (MmcQ/YjbR family)